MTLKDLLTKIPDETEIVIYDFAEGDYVGVFHGALRELPWLRIHSILNAPVREIDPKNTFLEITCDCSNC